MGMVRVRRHREAAPGQSRTVRFQGRDFGAPVSMFLTDSAPGTGSSLHRHPYPETWVVREGEAEFSVGEQRHRASAGDIVVAPAHVPHRFLNIGAGSLRLVCIHPSNVIVQEEL
ncbi:cupin domain-containing protein [Sabulicella glaciei]|uniref:Cupin domain-containing protein n=1 Tax=Sabulicella glaciei TaxID=2984948 RepID=A0ABT3P139_9PROT|nr:cupin domain-containing protein [Roseococcus sp. MDT2-1-1]MCW8088123.1 cupin domain-containing protein [Roseococcus sp. MDT2-1-1]